MGLVEPKIFGDPRVTGPSRYQFPQRPLSGVTLFRTLQIPKSTGRHLRANRIGRSQTPNACKKNKKIANHLQMSLSDMFKLTQFKFLDFLTSSSSTLTLKSQSSGFHRDTLNPAAPTKLSFHEESAVLSKSIPDALLKQQGASMHGCRSLYLPVWNHVHERAGERARTTQRDPFFLPFLCSCWIMDETPDIYIFFHVRAVCRGAGRSGKVQPSTK